MITRIQSPSFPSIGFGWVVGDMNLIRRPLDNQLYQVLIRILDSINDEARQAVKREDLC